MAKDRDERIQQENHLTGYNALAKLWKNNEEAHDALEMHWEPLDFSRTVWPFRGNEKKGKMPWFKQEWEEVGLQIPRFLQRLRKGLVLSSGFATVRA